MCRGAMNVVHHEPQLIRTWCIARMYLMHKFALPNINHNPTHVDRRERLTRGLVMDIGYQMSWVTNTITKQGYLNIYRRHEICIILYEFKIELKMVEVCRSNVGHTTTVLYDGTWPTYMYVTFVLVIN